MQADMDKKLLPLVNSLHDQGLLCLLIQSLVHTVPNDKILPVQKHVRKVVGGFGKRSCVSTGVRKPGNTCASP